MDQEKETIKRCCGGGVLSETVGADRNVRPYGLFRCHREARAAFSATGNRSAHRYHFPYTSPLRLDHCSDRPIHALPKVPVYSDRSLSAIRCP